MRTPGTCAAAKMVVCGVFWAVGALANPILVSDFSFEELPAGGLPFGCAGAGCAFSIDAIPGWVNTGQSGQFQPGTPANTVYFNTLSDGITNAFSNGGSITQTVAPVVQAGVTYTLLVDVGFRKDEPMAGAGFLLVNGVLHGGTFAVPPLTPGAFYTERIVYIGTSADAGLPITVDLESTGIQGNFDNVQLSDSNGVVPEPAYTGVLAACFAALAVFTRRKRA